MAMSWLLAASSPEEMVFNASARPARWSGECPLDNPSLGKDVESGFCRDSLDDFDLGSHAEAIDPAGEFRSAESPIGPNLFELITAENRSKKLLGSAAFGGVGRGNDHAQKPTQCVDTNEAFAHLGLLARIVSMKFLIVFLRKLFRRPDQKLMPRILSRWTPL